MARVGEGGVDPVFDSGDPCVLPIPGTMADCDAASKHHHLDGVACKSGAQAYHKDAR